MGTANMETGEIILNAIFLSSGCILWEINFPYQNVKLFSFHNEWGKFINVEQ